TFTVLADTTPATASAYGGRIGGLIAYRGDSTLFVDPQSQSMLVIDPAGKVGRVMAVPRSQDATMLGNPMMGTPALDASGRLVYRGFPRFQMMRPPTPGGGFVPPEMPESTAIVRVDLTSRQVDTVGFAKIPKMKMDMQRDDNGRVTVTMMMNPLPVVDEWAVLSDGSIALVRGRDYHVDWVRPNGTRESSPKIPFEWQRLTDEDKIAFIDSVKAARERMAAKGLDGGDLYDAVDSNGALGEHGQVPEQRSHTRLAEVANVTRLTRDELAPMHREAKVEQEPRVPKKTVIGRATIGRVTRYI